MDQNKNSSETKFDPELIEQIRRSSASWIAQELASVQPMPDVDWNTLGQAYAAIVALHGKEPFIPRPETPEGNE